MKHATAIALECLFGGITLLFMFIYFWNLVANIGALKSNFFNLFNVYFFAFILFGCIAQIFRIFRLESQPTGMQVPVVTEGEPPVGTPTSPENQPTGEIPADGEHRRVTREERERIHFSKKTQFYCFIFFVAALILAMVGAGLETVGANLGWFAVFISITALIFSANNIWFLHIERVGDERSQRITERATSSAFLVTTVTVAITLIVVAMIEGFNVDWAALLQPAIFALSYMMVITIFLYLIFAFYFKKKMT